MWNSRRQEYNVGGPGPNVAAIKRNALSLAAFAQAFSADMRELERCLRLNPEYHDNMAVVSHGDLLFESDDSAVEGSARNGGDLQEFAAIHTEFKHVRLLFSLVAADVNVSGLDSR
jgi:hypothetical protein